jgi:hypothetical protein
MIGRGRRFGDLVGRQLALFATEQAGLLHDCELALRAHRIAGRDEAEERWGDYLDLVDTARDELESIRDAYAETLDEAAAEEYEAAFNRLARKRFPRLGLELD